MPVVARRDGDRFRPGGQRRQRIDGEGVLCEDRRPSRREKDPRDEVEDVVGTVAEDDLLDAEPAARRQRLQQRELVRIARQVGRPPPASPRAPSGSCRADSRSMPA
jgi:hypothetical protein